jgi:mono/diheme cytochrome c family protein
MKNIFLIHILSLSTVFSHAQKKSTTDSSMLIGKNVYVQHCQTCHQVDGGGAQNMIPPLIKTEYVLGNKQRLIRTVLNGMKGEIKVNGDMYGNEMPQQAVLTDREIASVLSYVRKSFGNNAGPVKISEVKKVRAANTTSTQTK